MSLAPWRPAVARALHRNRSLPNARYLQLATVQANGRPANRTVVFRGFRAEQDQLQFICDRRSGKLQDIQHTPWAEVCWYFPQTREQFRISGRLHEINVLTSDPQEQALRLAAWQAISEAARQQFTWPTPAAAKADVTAFDATGIDLGLPLSTFCLLLLTPTQVDHLELRGQPQDRTRYVLDEETGQWQQDAINP